MMINVRANPSPQIVLNDNPMIMKDFEGLNDHEDGHTSSSLHVRLI